MQVCSVTTDVGNGDTKQVTHSAQNTRITLLPHVVEDPPGDIRTLAVEEVRRGERLSVLCVFFQEERAVRTTTRTRNILRRLAMTLETTFQKQVGVSGTLSYWHQREPHKGGGYKTTRV